MIRKVNKVGTNTLTISLPRKWVKKYGIKQGDELDIEEKDWRLLIQTTKNKERERITIKITDKDKFVKRLLFVPYVLGYNKIKVIFSDLKILEHVEKTVDLMMGFEIMSQEKDFCIITNIVKHQENKFDEVFRRLIFLVKTMGLDLEDELKVKNKELGKFGVMRRLSNRLSLICKRILHVRGHINDDVSMRYYQTINLLEKITSNFHYLSQYYEKQNISKKELELLIYVNTQIKFFVKAMLSKKENLSTFKEKTSTYIKENMEIHKLGYPGFEMMSILSILNQIMQEYFQPHFSEST